MKLVTWQNKAVGYLLRSGAILCPLCALDSDKDESAQSVPAMGVETCDSCKRPLFEAKHRRIGYGQ